MHYLLIDQSEDLVELNDYIVQAFVIHYFISKK